MANKSLPRTCWICGKAVKLEDCMVDEHGLPVHEDCCVVRIARNRHPQVVVRHDPKIVDWTALIRK